MIEFRSLELSTKSIFDAYTKNKYENSEASFANMFMWHDFYDIKYCEIADFLVVIFTDLSGRMKSYMPYGCGDLKKCVDLLVKYFESKGGKLEIVSADYDTANFLKSAYTNVSVEENINFNDYVYLTQSLISLSGKKLHSKKNHLNRFKNTYDYLYREIKKSDFDECMNLALNLMRKNRSENSAEFKAERQSIKNAFDNFDFLELCGGVIETDGKIRAFSVGEALTDKTALIHIEKADTSYSGIYAAINNEFAKNRWSDFEYINREEDMGIDGLRKAKMSYKPDHMVRKYICRF